MRFERLTGQPGQEMSNENRQDYYRHEGFKACLNRDFRQVFYELPSDLTQIASDADRKDYIYGVAEGIVMSIYGKGRAEMYDAALKVYRTQVDVLANSLESVIQNKAQFEENNQG